MKLTDFRIGLVFQLVERVYRVTDIGSRTVIAIELGDVEVTEDVNGAVTRRIVPRIEAEKRKWFDGPPYGVVEEVFDEWDLEAATELAELLPRSEGMEGAELRIERVQPNGELRITDGERTGAYGFWSGEQLSGRELRIAKRYVEAGRFTEANVVTLTDGERKAVYTALRAIEAE